MTFDKQMLLECIYLSLHRSNSEMHGLELSTTSQYISFDYKHDRTWQSPGLSGQAGAIHMFCNKCPSIRFMFVAPEMILYIVSSHISISPWVQDIHRRLPTGTPFHPSDVRMKHLHRIKRLVKKKVQDKLNVNSMNNASGNERFVIEKTAWCEYVWSSLTDMIEKESWSNATRPWKQSSSSMTQRGTITLWKISATTDS